MMFERLIRYFITHPTAANMLMVVFILAGLQGASSLRQEILPEFNPPAVIIEATLPGASATRMEKSILLPIERALQGENSIERVESQAKDNAVRITVELSKNASNTELQGIIKSKIDGIESLPNALENLVVYPRDTRSQITWVHIHGDVDKALLIPMARQLKAELTLLPEVSNVELVGLPEEEIAIEVSPALLKTHRLNMAILAEQIEQENLDADAGVIRSTTEHQLITRSESLQPEQIASLPISYKQNGQTIPLYEVAEVKRQFVEPVTISRLNGENAIGIAIFRDDNSPPLETMTVIKQHIEQMSARLPEDIHLSSWLDESRELQSRLSMMTSNGFFGLLLVLIILFLTTHHYIAIWVTIGLPVVYLAALWAMGLPSIDLSLNAITLFGFLIVSGILVDDALVVGESIYSTLEKKIAYKTQQEKIDSIVNSVKRIAVPTTFGVLTTIAAFIPLTQLDGDIGHTLGMISIVVILCLIFSIIESKLILPAHIYHAVSKNSHITVKPGPFQILLQRLRERYRVILQYSLNKPGLTINIALALLIVSIATVSSGWLRTTMIPDIADFELEALLTAPPGTSQAEKDQLSRQIEEALTQANQALRQSHDLDYDPVGFIFAVSEDEQTVALTVELSPRNDNPVSAQTLVETWRQALPELPPGYNLHLSASADPEDGINVQLEGADFDDLRDAADELQQVLSTIPGIYSIRDNADEDRIDYTMQLTEEAQWLGVKLETIATAARQALYGLEVQRLQETENEIKVMLRYPKQDRDSLDDLLAIPVKTSADTWLPLGYLAQVKTVPSISSIQRVNGYRVINVQANTDDTQISTDQVMDYLEDSYLETLIERYPGLTYRVEGEARESGEVSYSLLIASILAAIVIYALLTLPLQSYILPLWVLSIVPFGLIGVIAAHLLLSLPISLVSLFGVIALSGILVNDSLTLIYRLQRTTSTDLKQSIEEACLARFRPIIMTSLTTFLGVMPIIFETDPEALWLIPIAVSIGAGVLFGTAITLLLLPAMLYCHASRFGLSSSFSSALSSDLNASFNSDGNTDTEPDKNNPSAPTAAL